MVIAIKTICAWCGRHLNGPEDAVAISHGICRECFDEEVGKGEQREVKDAPDASDRQLEHELGGEG